MIRFDVITLFPEIFDAITRHGITGRAIDRGLAQLVAHNLRDYAHDSYKTTDDITYRITYCFTHFKQIIFTINIV